MRKRIQQGLLRTVLVSLWLCGGSAAAQEVPAAELEKLNAALSSDQKESSEARQRLAVKRVIRDGGKLLEAHPKAANRFEVLGVLFKAQRKLIKLDDSSRNRAALLETCKTLVKAPNEFADLRLEADLLLSQIEAARGGASSKDRLAKLLPMVERYRDTPAEARMLRTALVMALETGDPKVIRFLRDEMATRFAGDHEMISFQREKLGGQVFGAPFCGKFKTSDGSVMCLPGDVLGKLTILFFWSKDDPEQDRLQRLSEEWNKQRAEVSGRMQFLSFNVDELPDAGEEILRSHGVDWPALHLPGGRENPLYKTFPRSDPYLMTLSPTGYAALIMSGSTRKKKGSDGKTDYSRWFQSSLARDWSRDRYIAQLTSIFAGDFFVVDPTGPFDPNLPPEIKTGFPVSPASNPEKERDANLVPADVLQAIQACFVKAPQRYRLTTAEVRSNYLKVEELCAKAIAEFPDAPDLWIVRNRRIVAQLGLWKLRNDRSHYKNALAEAEEVLDSQGPRVLANYVLMKERLRTSIEDPKELIGEFVYLNGGENASGQILAAASLLALDIANRGLHDHYREQILEKHVDHAMMWTYVSFLLNREHRYWIFRVPFVAGWSYGRQHQWILSEGHPDEVERTVRAELKTFGGEAYSIPNDCKGKWTIVLFTNSWVKEARSPVPSTVTRYLNPFIENRGRDDVQVIVAVMDGEVGPIQEYLKEKPLNCETMILPGGSDSPLAQQLGVLDEDQQANALVLRPDGSVAGFISGMTMSRSKQQLVQNLIIYQDEKTVEKLIADGKIKEAKEYIYSLVPPFDPEAVDEKGRKLKKPVYNHVHLRARAHVYLALGNQEAAMADAEEVLTFLTSKGGWMSMRPEGLDEAEELVELLKKKGAE